MSYFFPSVLTTRTVNLPTQAEHQAAVQEFRALATDEEANRDRLVVLRDIIHAFEEANDHNSGSPRRSRVGCK